jgi:hypothetical protein
MKALLIVTSLLVFLLVRDAKAQGGGGCTYAMDCPGYAPDSFCSSVLCVNNQCVNGPSRCPQFCSETKKACVQCVTMDDCLKTGYPGQYCDATTNQCRWCDDNLDCPIGTWCNGGHWLCIQHRCLPPPDSFKPCANMGQCIEESHSCSRCYKDDDCGGPYNWCTHRVKCDLATMTCVAQEPLPSSCAFCDATRQQCLQCIADTDCVTANWQSAQPFCTPPVFVPVCTDGQCGFANNPSTAQIAEFWRPPCANKPNTLCDEERKSCLPRPIPPPQPSPPPAVPAPVPAQATNAASTLDAIPCTSRANCTQGWLCLVASPSDSNIRTCQPCRNSAQCILGTQQSVCSSQTGGCSPPLPLDETIGRWTIIEATADYTNGVVVTDQSVGSDGAAPNVVEIEGGGVMPSPTPAVTRVMWATVPSDAWFWLGIALGVLAMLLVVFMIYYISSNLLYRRRRKNVDTAKERRRRASTEDTRPTEVESPPPPPPTEPTPLAPEAGTATSARRLATSSAPLRAYAALQ